MSCAQSVVYAVVHDVCRTQRASVPAAKQRAEALGRELDAPRLNHSAESERVFAAAATAASISAGATAEAELQRHTKTRSEARPLELAHAMQLLDTARTEREGARAESAAQARRAGQYTGTLCMQRAECERANQALAQSQSASEQLQHERSHARAAVVQLPRARAAGGADACEAHELAIAQLTIAQWACGGAGASLRGATALAAAQEAGRSAAPLEVVRPRKVRRRCAEFRLGLTARWCSASTVAMPATECGSVCAVVRSVWSWLIEGTCTYSSTSAMSTDCCDFHVQQWQLCCLNVLYSCRRFSHGRRYSSRSTNYKTRSFSSCCPVFTRS